MTGARRGELCALRWSDIDLVGETIVMSPPPSDGPHIHTGREELSRGEVPQGQQGAGIDPVGALAGASRRGTRRRDDMAWRRRRRG